MSSFARDTGDTLATKGILLGTKETLLLKTLRSLVPYKANAQGSLVTQNWRIREPGYSPSQADLTQKKG